MSKNRYTSKINKDFKQETKQDDPDNKENDLQKSKDKIKDDPDQN